MKIKIPDGSAVTGNAMVRPYVTGPVQSAQYNSTIFNCM